MNPNPLQASLPRSFLFTILMIEVNKKKIKSIKMEDLFNHPKSVDLFNLQMCASKSAKNIMETTKQPGMILPKTISFHLLQLEFDRQVEQTYTCCKYDTLPFLSSSIQKKSLHLLIYQEKQRRCKEYYFYYFTFKIVAMLIKRNYGSIYVQLSI